MAKRVVFTDQAKTDLRAIDQRTALQILKTLARFAHSEEGNVKRLEGADPPLYRLRTQDAASSSATSRMPSRLRASVIDARPTVEPRPGAVLYSAGTDVSGPSQRVAARTFGRGTEGDWCLAILAWDRFGRIRRVANLSARVESRRKKNLAVPRRLCLCDLSFVSESGAQTKGPGAGFQG